MKNRKAFLLINCLFVFLLSGCWDQIAIEERGYVIGTAVGLADKQTSDHYKLHATNQIVVPAGLGSSSGKGGSGPKAYTNLSATGISLLEISRKMSTKTNRTPFYEHLKVLIVSKELAQEKGLFTKIMDVFIRDQEMRRSIKVIISEGKAKKILEAKPETEKLPAMYINSILEHSVSVLTVIDPVRVGDLQKHLLARDSFTLPKVSTNGKVVNNSGVAVFQGEKNKMVGVLTAEETKGLNLIMESNDNGAVKFEINDHLMVFEFQNTKSSIKIDTNNLKNIKISVSIQAEGSVSEMFGSRKLLTKKRIATIEKETEKRIKKLANQTIKKAQKELNTDIFGFGTRLKQRHYDQWQKIKDDWEKGENLFASSSITVSVNAIFRTTGATDKTKNNNG